MEKWQGEWAKYVTILNTTSGEWNDITLGRVATPYPMALYIRVLVTNVRLHNVLDEHVEGACLITWF